MSSVQLATPPSSLAPRGLVDIVSGSFGAGHDAAANAVAAQLADAGLRTRIWDIVDLMPGRLGRIVRSGYLNQVQSAPCTWRWVLDAIEHNDTMMSTVGRALQTTQRSLTEIAEDDPVAFISTHPFASQALGQLRAQGRLTQPVTTYLTDMSVHRMWVHKDVDRHLAIHAAPARAAIGLGAVRVTIVRPAVAARFTAPSATAVSQAAARRSLGLPELGRLALVTGGAHGIGSLLETARDLRMARLVTPVVLCGSDRRLLERVRRQPGMLALGWVTDMPGLLTAVDVIVQNAGGSTSLEAVAMDRPVITYRSIAGHGVSNAAALHAAGVAEWVHAPTGLAPAVARALLSGVHPRTDWMPLPSVVSTLFPQRAMIA